jgi:AGZA family xanthine/uracil permease-like MFS transporter
VVNITNRSTIATINTQVSSVSRATMADIMDPHFYKKESWVEEVMERLFKIQSRETSVKQEVYYGIIHFISCFYCLAVIPQQMNKAGYNSSSTFVATAACAGIGSITLGLFANLPFVMAPPTVVTIFFSVFLQNANMKNVTNVGSSGVIISGVLLMLMGYRPLGNFVGRLIPYSLQAGTAIGIGLLTALAGMTDIDYIQTGGSSQLLRLNSLTFEVCVAIGGVIIICLAQWYHIKGSFCIAIIVCSLVYNFYGHGWPKAVFQSPQAQYFTFVGFDNPHMSLLVLDLLFLYILYLNGLISSLSYLASLTRDNGEIPRGRWVFIWSGMITIISGLLTGAPVLISPESAAAIKEGAKTGLASVVCGLLFVFSIIFAPIFEAIPDAGTSPILLMIGVLLFQNVLRVDWKNVADATPAFVVLFFIPFSFSVVQGVLIGYVVYLTVGLCTGTLFVNLAIMLHIYFPQWAVKVGITLPNKLSLHGKGGDDDDEFDDCYDADNDDEDVLDRAAFSTDTDGSSGDIENGGSGGGASMRSHIQNAAASAGPDLAPRHSADSSSHSVHSITHAINNVIANVQANHHRNSIDHRAEAAAGKHHGGGRSRKNTFVSPTSEASEYMCMGFEGDNLFDLGVLSKPHPPPPTSPRSQPTSTKPTSTNQKSHRAAGARSRGVVANANALDRGYDTSNPQGHNLYSTSNSATVSPTHSKSNLDEISAHGKATLRELQDAAALTHSTEAEAVYVTTNPMNSDMNDFNISANKSSSDSSNSASSAADSVADAGVKESPTTGRDSKDNKSDSKDSRESTNRDSVAKKTNRSSLSTGTRTVDPALMNALIKDHVDDAEM